MRLKKLVVHGFKSFADRTEFAFDEPITGIVGPNGCGKSNVVDAFKWVLGEQSAKSLRGDAMMDVIFNGSSARKPANLAEVVLVFENPQRADGSRSLVLDVDEVAVGRRLFRDGNSEYTLNNASSRLKDIRELFLDTGVGVDAYSVIEQGRVAALLEANPDERRQIFEEAAGISKFKVKKKEAQRKLEKVVQNLLRVHDIVEEVEKRLRSVKVAAGKARNYKEYSDRLNELRLTYSLQEYHQLHQQVAALDKQREDLQFRLDDAAGDLAQRQNDLAVRRQELETLSQKRQAAEYELVQTTAQIESAQHKQDYARQQIEQTAEQLAAFEVDRSSTANKLEEVSVALVVEREALEQLSAELESKRQLIDERQQAFRDGQLKVNGLSREIEQNKSAVLDLMRKLAQVNSRLSAIEIERKNIAQHQQRLGDRRRVVVEESEVAQAKRADIDSKVADVLQQIASQQQQLEAKRKVAQMLGKKIAELGEQLGSAKEHRSGLLSREKLLKDLEAKREGVSEGVKSVLRQRETKFPFVRGLVADLLSVDVEHAHVIEAALDGRDQWLIASDSIAAAEAREAFESLEGRVNVICMDRVVCTTAVPAVVAIQPTGLLSIAAQDHGRDGHDTQTADGQDGRAKGLTYNWNRHSQRIRLAADLVRCEPENRPLLRHLLGDTIVVDSLADANAMVNEGATGFRFVTMAGEVIESDGTLRAGPFTASMGLLSRRSELEALTHQIREIDLRIAQHTNRLTEGNASARELEASQNELRNAVYASNTTKVELTSSLAQLNDKLSSLNRERPLLERELQSLFDQIGRLKEEESKLSQNRAAMDQDQSSRQQQIESATTELSKLTDDLKAWNEQLTVERVALGQVQEKQLQARSAVERHTSAKAELEQQLERLAKSAEAAVTRRTQIESELHAAQAVEQQLTRRKDQLAERVESLASQLAELQQAVTELHGQVESIRADHSELEQSLHSIQMKLGEERVRLESLINRTRDELQLDLPARYEEVTSAYNEAVQLHAGAERSAAPDSSVEAEVEAAPPPAPINPFQGDEDHWVEIAEEIKQLREKIARLGNVNLDAITELEELEQREQFYTTQVSDLTTSQQQLAELIDQINAESSIRFEQTFNAVKENFQGMFRKLFGGGSADIVLELEVDDKEATKAQAALMGPDDKTVLPVMRKTVDPLDAGIEIIARPPGKKPVTISQLSGGEKAMTCIALLMSIFKSKPSPFCILDEVDAPLDEANNQRFGLIVQEFLSTSQFIIITHHKRTMQIADVLYGVTMQEQGVSKRVSVKFDQVGSNGQISAEAVRAAEREERMIAPPEPVVVAA